MRVFVLGVLVACGPGLAADQPQPPRPGVPPPTDVRGFRKLLDGDVMNGGLWFADATCQARFGHYAKLEAADFDAFAGCVAGLHLRPSGREDALDDTSVLTDDAGFEIEAHVVKGRLDFIGFSGRVPGVPDLPSITPQAFESLRTGGDPNATISDEEATRARDPNPTAHLRICLGDDGQLTTIIPAVNMSFASATAYSALARAWTFKPFVVAGKAMPVCAIVGFQYPATPRDPKRDQLPIPARRSKAGNLIYNAHPRDLELLRLSGERYVYPDDRDKLHLRGKRISGSFKLCLDETGHYESGTLLQSTGIPNYDAKIARSLMQWVYRPYIVDGAAVPVCGGFTFIYSQR